MIIDIKTAEQLTEEMEQMLIENTDITYLGDGSLTKSMLYVVNEKLSDYYEELDFALAMSFVSKANGTFLDMIGELLDCERNFNETDDNFRYRITNQVNKKTAANKYAIRLSCLSIENVRDIRMKAYTKGAGTFTAFVDLVDPNMENTTLQQVQEKIEEAEGFGILGEVLIPEYQMVDISFSLSLEDGLTQQRKNVIRRNCEDRVESYIRNLGIGKNLSASKIVEIAMQTDNNLKDIKVNELFIDDEPRTFSSKSLDWDEQFKPREVIAT